MKRINRYIVLLLASVLMFTSCGDEPLMIGPGYSDYFIINGFMENYDSTGNPQIVKDGAIQKIYIDGYVGAYRHDDRYIVALQYDKINSRDEMVNRSNGRFFILDTKTGTVYGPYNSEEYHVKREELNITELSEWAYLP